MKGLRGVFLGLLCVAVIGGARGGEGRRGPRAVSNSLTVGGGKGGKDFPTYASIPKTSFSCKGKDGYYADEETGCQAFHICHSSGRKDSFLCSIGTIFSPSKKVCSWWYNVQCQKEVEVEESSERDADTKRVAAKSKNQLSSAQSTSGRSGRKQFFDNDRLDSGEQNFNSVSQAVALLPDSEFNFETSFVPEKPRTTVAQRQTRVTTARPSVTQHLTTRHQQPTGRPLQTPRQRTTAKPRKLTTVKPRKLTTAKPRKNTTATPRKITTLDSKRTTTAEPRRTTTAKARKRTQTTRQRGRPLSAVQQTVQHTRKQSQSNTQDPQSIIQQTQVSHQQPKRNHQQKQNNQQSNQQRTQGNRQQQQNSRGTTQRVSQRKQSNRQSRRRPTQAVSRNNLRPVDLTKTTPSAPRQNFGGVQQAQTFGRPLSATKNSRHQVHSTSSHHASSQPRVTEAPVAVTTQQQHVFSHTERPTSTKKFATKQRKANRVRTQEATTSKPSVTIRRKLVQQFESAVNQAVAGRPNSNIVHSTVRNAAVSPFNKVGQSVQVGKPRIRGRGPTRTMVFKTPVTQSVDNHQRAGIKVSTINKNNLQVARNQAVQALQNTVRKNQRNKKPNKAFGTTANINRHPSTQNFGHPLGVTFKPHKKQTFTVELDSPEDLDSVEVFTGRFLSTDQITSMHQQRRKAHKTNQEKLRIAFQRKKEADELAAKEAREKLRNRPPPPAQLAGFDPLAALRRFHEIRAGGGGGVPGGLPAGLPVIKGAHFLGSSISGPFLPPPHLLAAAAKKQKKRPANKKETKQLGTKKVKSSRGPAQRFTAPPTRPTLEDVHRKRTHKSQQRQQQQQHQQRHNQHNILNNQQLQQKLNVNEFNKQQGRINKLQQQQILRQQQQIQRQNQKIHNQQNQQRHRSRQSNKAVKPNPTQHFFVDFDDIEEFDDKFDGDSHFDDDFLEDLNDQLDDDDTFEIDDDAFEIDDDRFDIDDDRFEFNDDRFDYDDDHHIPRTTRFNRESGAWAEELDNKFKVTPPSEMFLPPPLL